MAASKTGTARSTVGTRIARKVPAKGAPASSERKHTVKASLRNVDLTKATSALNLALRADGEKIGELVVGRGSFFWRGRNSKKRLRITWSDFADLMNNNAK